MKTLDTFLAGNALKTENIEFVASKRFLCEDGNPAKWELRCISPEEDERIRRECTKRVPVPGKKGQYIPEMDANAYMGKLAAACTFFPNLNDKELQDSYHVMSADALLKAMLIPGEYANYLNKVQEVNGFDISMDELVDEAKN